MKNHLLFGNWNALCDVCGFKFKALDLKRDWRGLMVCKEDFENRHPSDFLRVQKEKITVDFSRPYPVADVYLSNICSVREIVGKADIGTADCARTGLDASIGSYAEETLWIDKDPLSISLGSGLDLRPES